MSIFRKYAFEEFTRYHEFRRSDGTGWLTEGETIQGTPSVTCSDAAGVDTSASMVGTIGGGGTTRAVYIVKGGEAGKSYTFTIRIASTNGQQFEDRVIMEVI